jgi:hypothetical protein
MGPLQDNWPSGDRFHSQCIWTHTHQEEDQLNPALARWQRSLVLENPPTSSLTTQWIRHPALFI